MPKKLYTSIPKNYPVCQYSDCPMAVTCLRQLPYTALLENEEYIHLINPKKCSKDETCKYYRGNQPVMYARGCTNFQKRKFPDQYLKFMNLFRTKSILRTQKRGNYPIPQRTGNSPQCIKTGKSNRKNKIQ